jgi:transposase
MRQLANTLQQRLGSIVTYCTRGITNGVAEGISSQIMSMQAQRNQAPRNQTPRNQTPRRRIS